MKLRDSHEADTKHIRICERITQLKSVLLSTTATEEEKGKARVRLGQLRIELNGSKEDERQ